MVVAIIGIMAAIAVPSYSGFILKQRRADAHHFLNKNAHQLQRCLTLVGAYDGACNVLTTSTEGHYTLDNTVSTRTAQTWSLTAIAVPNGKQKGDTDCASISLNHTGQKSATGDLPDSCW